MKARREAPLAAVLRGLGAGALGTGVMTAGQAAYMKATDSEPSTIPAEVAKRIIGGVFGHEVPEQHTGQLNNAMHWLYGTSWGAVYGIATRGRSPSAARSGLLFGLAVWGASLAHLSAMKLAPPPWEYSPSQIAPDLGFHLTYGLGVAAAFKAVER